MSAQPSLAKRTHAFLRQYDLVPRKSLGQNFLITESVVDRILEAADLTPAGAVLEIGPGLGALTERLAQAAAQVVAVEKDKQLVAPLSELLKAFPNVHLLEADALRLDLADVLRTHASSPDQEWSVVANLPYAVAGPLLASLIGLVRCRTWVVMLQQEVAQRLLASPRSRAYTSLTVRVQRIATVERVMQVGGGHFVPQPRVVSTVLRLRRRPEPIFPDAEGQDQVLRLAFAQRRKQLVNVIRSTIFPASRTEVLAACQAVGVDAHDRAEDLDVPAWGRLLPLLREMQKQVKKLPS